jgi:hypothetical protein
MNRRFPARPPGAKLAGVGPQRRGLARLAGEFLVESKDGFPGPPDYSRQRFISATVFPRGVQ